MSRNAVFRRGADGKWRTGDDEKVLRLKRIFRSMDREGMGALSASALMAGLRNRDNELHTVFGPQKADNLLAAFQRLDGDRTGAISEAEFVERASLAFQDIGELHRTRVDPTTLADASPAAVDVPPPPPMTRELTYRALFLEIDHQRKGFVTLADIVRVLNARLPSIREVFGEQDARRALDVFSRLDHSGEGRVSWRDFFECAELAFTKHASAGPQQTVAGEPVVLDNAMPAPHPPPMTRELLYRSVFAEVDSDRSGSISQMQLVRAMNKRRSSIALIFGAEGTDSALTAFRRMDQEGDGVVTFNQFFETCEEAFYESEEDEEESGPCPLPVAAPAGGASALPAPTPPRMTRELLYRAVWDSIDSKKRGFITVQDLIACVRGARGANLSAVFGVDNTEAAMRAFQAMDVDGDGRLSWVDFFDKAEEVFVAQASERQPAPRRESLLQPVASATGRRPSYLAPPPLPGSVGSGAEASGAIEEGEEGEEC